MEITYHLRICKNENQRITLKKRIKKYKVVREKYTVTV